MKTELTDSSSAQKNPAKFYAILLLLCCVCATYCCWMNYRLYQHRAPFFDSISYNHRMFQVMHTAQESGFGDAIELACFGTVTNCFQFVVGAVLSYVVPPSRFVGVWIQAGFLFLFLGSLFHFLHSVKRLKPLFALAGCLPFLLTKGLYLPNGGLSDFRADLALYLTFGLTCVWFLISMARPKPLNFCILGIAATLACLSRAIAPVYLVIALAPLAVYELCRRAERKQKWIGLVLATVVATIGSGWFYYFNFEYLEFYYVQWNTDANAKLPVSESMKHATLALRSVGNTILIVSVIIVFSTVFVTSRSGSLLGWALRIRSKQEIDWRLAWLAVAPIALLVVRRSGLNSLVSMPAVFGIIAFISLPILFQLQRLNRSGLNRFCLLLLVLVSVDSLHRGWKRHSLGEFNSMSVNQELIDTMVSEVKESTRKTARFSVVHLADLNTQSLFSTLMFDHPVEEYKLNRAVVDGVLVSPISLFSLAAEVDWKRVEGKTDEEKIASLVAESNKRLDFVILPDHTTAKYLTKNRSKNVINRYLVPLRKQFVDSASWEKVESGWRMGRHESVELYKKVRSNKKRNRKTSTFKLR